MDAVKVTTVIEIDGQSLVLAPEQARELYNALRAVFEPPMLISSQWSGTSPLSPNILYRNGGELRASGTRNAGSVLSFPGDGFTQG